MQMFKLRYSGMTYQPTFLEDVGSSLWDSIGCSCTLIPGLWAIYPPCHHIIISIATVFPTRQCSEQRVKCPDPKTDRSIGVFHSPFFFFFFFFGLLWLMVNCLRMEKCISSCCGPSSTNRRIFRSRCLTVQMSDVFIFSLRGCEKILSDGIICARRWRSGITLKRLSSSRYWEADQCWVTILEFRPKRYN